MPPTWPRRARMRSGWPRRTAYDAIILDVMLPGSSGSRRAAGSRADVWTPVLMLTARDGVDDRVAGLDAGADDYLAKPFAFAELLARLRALVRRGAVERPTSSGRRRSGSTRRRARPGAATREIGLSAKEFALLETFMRRPGQVLSRSPAARAAWDFAYENRSNVVDVYVRYLREKIDRPFGAISIETVRGRGYRLRATDGCPEPPADQAAPHAGRSRSRWPSCSSAPAVRLRCSLARDLDESLDQSLR